VALQKKVLNSWQEHPRSVSPSRDIPLESRGRQKSVYSEDFSGNPEVLVLFLGEKEDNLVKHTQHTTHNTTQHTTQHTTHAQHTSLLIFFFFFFIITSLSLEKLYQGNFLNLLFSELLDRFIDLFGFSIIRIFRRPGVQGKTREQGKREREREREKERKREREKEKE
jgi:hypothetical protein